MNKQIPKAKASEKVIILSGFKLRMHVTNPTSNADMSNRYSFVVVLSRVILSTYTFPRDDNSYLQDAPFAQPQTVSLPY